MLVFKSFIRPILEYGCALMSIDDGMVEHMEKIQNQVLNMVLSCARTTSRGAKLKLLKVETMKCRVEKLQYCFFNALERNGLNDAPASIIWHDSGNTAMKVMAFANPIVEFSKVNDYTGTMAFIRTRKFESMAVYDSSKEGRLDIAASTQTPRRVGPSIYTESALPRDDQLVVTFFRLGAYAFHQACNKCGEPTSRDHAMECSGELRRLTRLFPRRHDSYVSQHQTSPPEISFIDFLLNRMDTLFASKKNIHRDRALVIFRELAETARTIRRDISGYIATEDGRAWYHPSKKVRSSYKHYAQNIRITLQRKAIADKRNRPVGRPSNLRPSLFASQG